MLLIEADDRFEHIEKVAVPILVCRRGTIVEVHPRINRRITIIYHLDVLCCLCLGESSPALVFGVIRELQHYLIVRVLIEQRGELLRSVLRRRVARVIWSDPLAKVR